MAQADVARTRFAKEVAALYSWSMPSLARNIVEPVALSNPSSFPSCPKCFAIARFTIRTARKGHKRNVVCNQCHAVISSIQKKRVAPTLSSRQASLQAEQPKKSKRNKSRGKKSSLRAALLTNAKKDTCQDDQNFSLEGFLNAL